MYPKQSGVYCFKNTVNNKVYIGSAKNLNKRIKEHLNATKSNQHLQNAIKHYGIDSFCITYQVLETKEQALCLEQMLLDYVFKLNINCYNISFNATAGAGSNAKVRYALEVSKPQNVLNFKSGAEAAEALNIDLKYLATYCKKAKPLNSESGRWLFSDVSIEDLKAKFNNLTHAEIKSKGNLPFVLIKDITNEMSQIFYNCLEPEKLNYNITISSVSKLKLGKRRICGGYRLAFIL